jgi:hypothetical protein
VTLEGQITRMPGYSSASCELWHAGHRAVRRSESAAEPQPQVRITFLLRWGAGGRSPEDFRGQLDKDTSAI